MKIRSERKFAALIDDANAPKSRVGYVIDLPIHDAKMLLTEGWAISVESELETIASSAFIDFPETPNRR